MSKEKKKAERQSRVMDRYVPDDILELVNNKEDFEKKLKDSLEEIKKKADEENLVLFSDLLEDKTSEDVINHLLPLLFLANDKKVSMWQEKAFGEIFILLLDAEIKLFKEEKNGGKRAEKTGRSSAVHVA